MPGNLLGGIGSGLAYAGGTTFLALPDLGPNAVPYAADTVSYIARFQTLNLSLSPTSSEFEGKELPFTLTPTLCATTLLSSPTALVYGSGADLLADELASLGSGVPALNAVNHTYYFTGRSDNFDPGQLSTYPKDARIDPESIRVSRDGAHVFVSDEYGSYVYEFNRETGRRTRSFTLPDNLAINVLSPQKAVENGKDGNGNLNNPVGRVTTRAWKVSLSPRMASCW